MRIEERADRLARALGDIAQADYEQRYLLLCREFRAFTRELELMKALAWELGRNTTIHEVRTGDEAANPWPEARAPFDTWLELSRDQEGEPGNAV